VWLLWVPAALVFAIFGLWLLGIAHPAAVKSLALYQQASPCAGNRDPNPPSCIATVVATVTRHNGPPKAAFDLRLPDGTDHTEGASSNGHAVETLKDCGTVRARLWGSDVISIETAESSVPTFRDPTTAANETFGPAVLAIVIALALLAYAIWVQTRRPDPIEEMYSDMHDVELAQLRGIGTLRQGPARWLGHPVWLWPSAQAQVEVTDEGLLFTRPKRGGAGGSGDDVRTVPWSGIRRIEVRQFLMHDYLVVWPSSGRKVVFASRAGGALIEILRGASGRSSPVVRDMIKGTGVRVTSVVVTAAVLLLTLEPLRSIQWFDVAIFAVFLLAGGGCMAFGLAAMLNYHGIADTFARRNTGTLLGSKPLAQRIGGGIGIPIGLAMVLFAPFVVQHPTCPAGGQPQASIFLTAVRTELLVEVGRSGVNTLGRGLRGSSSWNERGTNLGHPRIQPGWVDGGRPAYGKFL
jgi:hypothetical protein